MGKLRTTKSSGSHIEYFSEYSFPYIVLDSYNTIHDANLIFFNELKYKRKDIIGVKKITDISVSASDERLGEIDASLFLNSNDVNITDFIALKQSDGKLRYFFFRMNNSDDGKRILFLYEHSNMMKNIEMMQAESDEKPFMSAFPGIMIVFDRKLVVSDISVLGNIGVAQMFNVEPGKRIQDTSAPDELKKISVEYLEHCRDHNTKTEFEFRMEVKGLFRIFNFRLFPHKKQIVALISDVTEEKNMLTQLIKSQKELKDLIDEMPVAVALTDSKGRIIFYNTHFSQLTKIAKVPVAANIYEYTGRKLFGVLKNNGTGKKVHCFQFGKIYVDVTSKKRIIGREVQHIISFVDVTEREKAKKALETSYKEHKILVDTSPNGIIIRDFKKVYYANPEALRLLGFKKAKDIDLSLVMSKEDLDSIRNRFITLQAGDDVEFIEYTIVPVDTGKPITVITKPILIDYKGKQAFQVVFRNNSTEKLLVEERVKKQLLEGHNKKLKREIARRIEIESKLNKTIDENKLLINEVHHRVKNNYQIISSMLNRCTTNISDPASIQAIDAVKSRLVSMAIVNDFYMDAENYNSIQLIEYLKKIYQNFLRENGSGSMIDKVCFRTSIRNLVADLNDAIPIGLIFNEILTILYQLVDNLSDKFCNFVSLKWQNKNSLMFTVSFDKELQIWLENKFNGSAEEESLKELLEQVDGNMLCRFDKAELQLIVKLSK